MAVSRARRGARRLSDARPARHRDAAGRADRERRGPCRARRRDRHNAESFATLVVTAAPGAERLVTLPEAERVLAALERLPEERAA